MRISKMACYFNKIVSGKQGILSRNFCVLKNAPGSTAETGSKAANRHEIHVTAPRSYPSAVAIKLPDNIQEINASEVGCFSPLRSRDISGSFISYQECNEISEHLSTIDITVDSDPHINSYDCRGAVSLSSSMQSNVPSPFGGQGSILGMPGSQWGQGHKYLSDYLHNSHYLNLRNTYSRSHHSTKAGISRLCHTVASSSSSRPSITNLLTSNCLHMVSVNNSGRRLMSDAAGESRPPSKVEQLKMTVAAYGSTVIVFHVAISLVSLGGCYLLVSSGLDTMAIIEYVGLAESSLAKNITANAGTFVVAYAIHKMFAPVRIGITLTATPFIVRHLRKIGILKTPKPKA